MRTVLSWIVLPALAAASMTACGADTFLGNYSYSQTSAYMLTSPIAYNTSASDTGTLHVTAGTNSTYAVAWTNMANNDSCTLNANRNGSDVTIPSGQACTIHDSQGHPYTGTITSGGVSMSDNNTLTVNIAFDITSTNGVGGTGTRVITGMRLAGM